MARKKISKEILSQELEPIQTIAPSVDFVAPVSTVNPLLQEFGNGDLNILRDKVNEIIKHIS